MNLIQRLKQATGPDREIDRDIASRLDLPRAETQGATESIIGTWLKKKGLLPL